MKSRNTTALLHQLVKSYQQQAISPSACRLLAEHSQLCTRLVCTQPQPSFGQPGNSWHNSQYEAYTGHFSSRLFSAQPQPATEDEQEDDRSASGSHAQPSARSQPASAASGPSSRYSNAPHQQSGGRGRDIPQHFSSSRIMSTLVGDDTAKKCDEIIDRLTSTQSKAEGGRPSTRMQSLAQQLRHYIALAWNGYLSVQSFVLSIPGAVMHHIALPWADKKEVYKGWWQVIKHEAKHYWVRIASFPPALGHALV